MTSDAKIPGVHEAADASIVNESPVTETQLTATYRHRLQMEKAKYEILRFKVRDTLYIIESPNLFLIAAIALLAGGVLLTLMDISLQLYAIGGRWWNSLTIL
jgi:hypothetical protein